MKKSFNKLFSDKIRVLGAVATAGMPDENALNDVIGQLEKSSIKVKNFLPPRSPSTPAYLAADAPARAEAFNRAVSDPEIDMLLCIRGGFGSVHILDQINYDLLRKRQLPVMGYSDVTALHCAMLKNHAGIAIAGSNIIGLDQAAADDFSCTAHQAALTLDPAEPICLTLPENIEPAISGISLPAVTAPAYAANLTVLSSLCGTAWMPDFSNMILIIEDVNEAVYKLDRMLMQLTLCGVFDHIAALVFGSFSGTDDPRELDRLMERTARSINAPCFKNFPFGHQFPMCAINSAQKMTVSCGRQLFIA